MCLMAVVEFVLWATICFLFWTRKLPQRFPAMGMYLALRVAAMPVLLFFFFGQLRHWFNDYSFNMYFYSYWAVYVASAVLLYFICIEVFRSALSAFSGIQRLGIIAFRWAALVAVLLSFSTLSLSHPSSLMIVHTAYRLMRSVSILEICLLAFLCLSMNALNLSVRNLAFGLSLGFGIMSSSDFILASFWTRKTSMTDAFQFVSEALILVSLGIWVTYAALPEPARQPVVLPANSTILRWNEIASALGHTGTQVSVQPAEGFVLTDVEKVVEGLLTRNLKNRESES